MGNISIAFLLFLGFACTSLAANCPGCLKEENTESLFALTKLKVALMLTKATPEGVEDEKIKIIKITKTTSQVVTGMKYTYDFTAQGLNTHNFYNCHLVTVEKAWLLKLQVLKYKCSPVENKRALPGGEVELRVNDEVHLPRLRQVIAAELNKQFKSDYLMGVVKFIKASRQVVSGNMFRAKVEVAETNCLASQTGSFDNCIFQQKGHQLCDVAVFEKPWLHLTQVSVKSCTDLI